MNNLFQQLGGSFGIAILNTYVTSMVQYHRSDLVSYLGSSNQLFTSRVSELAGGFVAHGYSLPAAKAAALAAISGSVQAQSATMAYDDAFIVVALVFVLVLPLLVFFRPGQAEIMHTSVEM